MPHILIVGAIHPAGLARLEARPGVTQEMHAAIGDAELLDRAAGADAIIVRTRRLPAAVIDAAPRLKVVSRHGVGFDNVDVAALDRRRIPLAVVGNVNAVTVAEHTLFLMLTLAKRGIVHDRALRRGDWAVRDDFAAIELSDRRLLLLGFGRVGRLVAARARAFDMEIVVHDPFVDDAAIIAAGGRPAGRLDQALAEADFVSVHLPLSPETANLIDGAALRRMKPTAFVVNTARGGIVDEAALAEALRGGQIAGAGLDVFADEPPPPDSPLLGLDSVVLSPHVAGLTLECAIRMAVVSADNALAGLDGRLDPALVVNRVVL